MTHKDLLAAKSLEEWEVQNAHIIISHSLSASSSSSLDDDDDDDGDDDDDDDDHDDTCLAYLLPKNAIDNMPIIWMFLRNAGAN